MKMSFKKVLIFKMWKFKLITPSQEDLLNSKTINNVRNLYLVVSGGFRVYALFDNAQSLITNKNQLYLQNSEQCKVVEIPKL
jgi:hypothetical protein